MVNPRVVECVRALPVPLLDVPVTVIVYEPVFAVAEAVRVSVDVADVVLADRTRVVVDHFAVTPAGSCPVDSTTEPANPPLPVTLTA
jgi:hypothetical protein